MKKAHIITFILIISLPFLIFCETEESSDDDNDKPVQREDVDPIDPVEEEIDDGSEKENEKKDKDEKDKEEDRSEERRLEREKERRRDRRKRKGGGGGDRCPI